MGQTFTRAYLRLHLWLRRRCDRMSPRRRKIFVYTLSLLYLITSCVMIANLFLPKAEKSSSNIIVEEVVDSPILRDSVRPDMIMYQLACNNGKETERTT
ncbi:hypothetical protein HMPREF1989_01403 [Porphyromonas gingivalis F0566]|uniref:hypothetical protein n=1 Tax=Porphyromonas gingivalis TaxID=837 RepID=UPI0003ACDB6E|nr:hypothetical protein [Porphyromonas gingivalis]ERJ86104.1 hypothetical protein HMPREF1989_01403 [Porphyromonas gingivalis F0566]